MMTDDQNDPTWKRDDEPDSEHPSRQESPREFGDRESPPNDPDAIDIDKPTLDSSNDDDLFAPPPSVWGPTESSSE